jgi:hypothetical protein
LTGEAEYILWFLKGPQSTAPISSSGALGSSSSLVNELGDNDPTKGPTSGGRLTLAYWQYDDNTWAAHGSVRTLGFEARFFFVGRNSAEIAVDSPAYLYRPFYDLNDHVDSGFLVSAPGVANGSITARGQSSIWGAEANIWKNMYYDKPGTTYAIDFMVGLRYLNATSELDINSNSVYNSTIPAASPYASFAGNRLQVSDSFTAHNQFYGGQVGVGMTSWLTDCVAFESSLRFAIGTTREDVTILGSQVRTLANGTTVTSNGGLLALPSNIGPHSNTAFTQVPEANFKALFPIGKQLTLSAGFSALYWNRVARAADQVDHNIDITQIPNFPAPKGTTPTATGSPGVFFPQSQLWLLGISVGAEYRW